MRLSSLVACYTLTILLALPTQGQTGPSSKTGQRIEVNNAQVSLIQNTFVATSIHGIVDEVCISEGDRVEVGDRLIQLNPDQAARELDAANATCDAAKLLSENNVHVRYAQRTLEVRQREVEQSHEANQRYSGTISEAEISKQQLEVDQARLAIEQAEHDQLVALARVREKQAAILIAETQLGRHEITAPVGGEVVEVSIELGEWVDTGKPMVRIVSLDPIRVECFVDGTAFSDELVGRKVEFYPATHPESAALADKPLRGQVTFVSPELHPVTGQARLWATVENPDRKVRAGMLGRLVIQTP